MYSRLSLTNAAAPANAFRLGPLAQAEVDPLLLAQLTAPTVSLSAWLRLSSRLSVADVVSYRSAWGAFGLHLDPIGSVAFAGGKPRPWVMVPRFSGFPERALTLEWLLCPARAHSRTTLVSYLPGNGRACALSVQNRGTEGLVLSINGRELNTGVYLDFHQWQYVAVTWRSSDGRACLYKENGVAAIVAQAEGRTVGYGAPVFTGTVAAGEQLSDGGCLVIGQECAVLGTLADLVPDAGLVGALRSVRLWSVAHELGDLNHYKRDWLVGDEPGLVACWYFTRRSLEMGECVNACSSTTNVGLLGGLTVAALRDVDSYQVLLNSAGQTMASRVLLLPRRWQHVAASCRGWAVGAPFVDKLLIDGVQVPLEPLAPNDAPPPAPHFRVGPLANSLMADLRICMLAEGELLAHYTGELTPDGQLHDVSGNGFDLRVGGEFKLEPFS
ncbi:hypothetical protein BUMB_03329c [Candidatus Paraburkholderia calva]|nr:hypothetical protein BUMB_03329c [Candidatus Paraburkholderia calva]